MHSPRPFVAVAALGLLGAAFAYAPDARAQITCPGGYVGCASAPIAYSYREGLPADVNIDTGWVPGGSPLQVRFILDFDGQTAVNLAGTLQAGWPTPMALQAVGTPGAGSLSVDYGIVFDAEVQLHLSTALGSVSWSGSIPYVPMIDFRAMATQTFDPWAWMPVTADGMTARVHIADISLTDAIISIPGISGGLSFDASGEVSATYQSTEIDFGLDAPPITPTTPVVQGEFTAGPSVTYSPTLEGTLSQTGTLHVYPGLYVTLAGHTWTIDLADIPIPIGPFNQSVPFAPSVVTLGLPLFTTEVTDIEFGDVNVGTTANNPLWVDNHGEGDGEILGADPALPFSLEVHTTPVPPSSRAGLVVDFAPTTPGPADAYLSILTNDPTNPRLTVHVHGNGIAPVTVDTDAGGPPDDADDGSTDGGEEASVEVLDGGLRHAAASGGCGCTVPRRAPRNQTHYGALAALIAVSTARRRCRRTDWSRVPGRTADR